MNERYIFDKREIKKIAKTFAIKLAIAFPFILLVIILTGHWNMWASYGLAMLVGLVVYGLCTWIWYLVHKPEEPEKKTSTKQKNKKH